MILTSCEGLIIIKKAVSVPDRQPYTTPKAIKMPLSVCHRQRLPTQFVVVAFLLKLKF